MAPSQQSAPSTVATLLAGAALGAGLTAAASWLWRRRKARFAFAAQHAAEAEWQPLFAPYVEARDLGLKAASGGRYHAHHVRVMRGAPDHAADPDFHKWHTHDVELQFVYVLRGEISFEYEGRGENTFRAGSCFVQPRGIRHRELGHSDDMELLEVHSPGEMATLEAAAPEGGG